MCLHQTPGFFQGSSVGWCRHPLHLTAPQTLGFLPLPPYIRTTTIQDFASDILFQLLCACYFSCQSMRCYHLLPEPCKSLLTHVLASILASLQNTPFRSQISFQTPTMIVPHPCLKSLRSVPPADFPVKGRSMKCDPCLPSSSPA